MLVLLRRDGVLVESGPDRDRDPRDIVLQPGAAEAVRRLNDGGHRVVLLADRSGPNGAPWDASVLEPLHARLRDALKTAGARLDHILLRGGSVSAGASAERGAGALGEALRLYRSPPAEAVAITDILPDLEQAAALGCPRILVRTGAGARTQATGLPRSVLPLLVHEDLRTAVGSLLGGSE
jgi:D-glycero-D-manno-heptose 1,7-bisphosphate phosphatase